MSKARRKVLAAIVEEIEKARTLLEEQQSKLQFCAEEEREYYDNMPESIQQSERGEAASTAADALEEEAIYLGEVIQNLGTIIDNINSSTGE